MAQAVHDMTGRACKCGFEFKANSYSGTITRLKEIESVVDGKVLKRMYRVPERVCRKCHNEHYEKGE